MKRPRRDRQWIEFCLIQDKAKMSELRDLIRSPYRERQFKVEAAKALRKMEHKTHRYIQWLEAHVNRWKRDPKWIKNIWWKVPRSIKAVK